MRLVDEVELYLKGIYKIRVSKATMYSYLPDIDSAFIKDTPKVKKALEETIVIGRNILTISDMVYNGHNVKILNRDKIPVMYERIEAYLDEAKGFYNEGVTDEELSLKIVMLDNLSKTLLSGYKERILMYINKLDVNFRPKRQSNFVSLGELVKVDKEAYLDEFKRDDKLIFTYGA